MYVPQDLSVLIDFGSTAGLVIAFALALALVVRLRSPDARGLGEAAEALTELSREIDRRRAAIVLVAITAVLTGLGALVAYSTSTAPYVFALRLNETPSVPASVNFLQLFTTATLALLAARPAAGRERLGWVALALAFYGAGLDEAASIHDRFDRRTGLSEELALLPLAALVIVALALVWPRLRASPPALPLLVGGGAMAVISQGFDLVRERWAQRIVEEPFELAAGALFVLSMLAVIQAGRPGDLPAVAPGGGDPAPTGLSLDGDGANPRHYAGTKGNREQGADV